MPDSPPASPSSSAPSSAALNPKVTAHIAKALRFEVERDKGVLSDEWQVVLEFYAVLHWMRAACTHLRQEKRKADPSFPKVQIEGHRQFTAAMEKLDIPEDTRDDYADLRDISEWGRYGVTPEKEITPDVKGKSRRLSVSLRAWAVGELIAAGYTCN